MTAPIPQSRRNLTALAASALLCGHGHASRRSPLCLRRRSRSGAPGRRLGVGVEFTTPDTGWYDVDITALARSAITDQATTLSVSLTAAGTTNSDHTFAAKELDGGASAAKLVIPEEGPE